MLIEIIVYCKFSHRGKKTNNWSKFHRKWKATIIIHLKIWLLHF